MIKAKNTLVINNRALSNRRATIRAMSAVPAYVFRKSVLPMPTQDVDAERAIEAYGGLTPISESEEHAYEYLPVGYIVIRVVEYMGGTMNTPMGNIVSDSSLMRAMVEVVDMNLEGEEQIRNVPDWSFSKGDIACLLISEDLKEYFECTGIRSEGLLGANTSYDLAKRYENDYSDVFDDENIQDVEM